MGGEWKVGGSCRVWLEWESGAVVVGCMHVSFFFVLYE